MKSLRSRTLAAVIGTTSIAVSLLGAVEASAQPTAPLRHSTDAEDEDESDDVVDCDDDSASEVLATAQRQARAATRRAQRATYAESTARRAVRRAEASGSESRIRRANRTYARAHRAAERARATAAKARAAANTLAEGLANCGSSTPTPTPTPTPPPPPTPTPSVPPTPGTLPAPTGLSAGSATSLNSGAFRLTWNAVPGATGYNLYRGGSLIGSTAGTSFTPTITTNIRNLYTVAATDSSGVSPQSTAISAGAFQGTAAADKRGVVTYGQIQVSIAVTGTQVTGCWATYPTSSDSGPINSYAIPTLCSETITAQSATIASVSGASATSPAFKTSLQDALTRAGL